MEHLERVPAGLHRAGRGLSALPRLLETSARLVAEFVRRRSGLLAEEPREMRRIGEGELLGNVVDRPRGEDQLALGFGQHALTDKMTCGDAGCAFDMVVEPVHGHADLFGIKAEQAFLAEML